MITVCHIKDFEKYLVETCSILENMSELPMSENIEVRRYYVGAAIEMRHALEEYRNLFSEELSIDL